jgi:hypothetical protein
MERKSLHGNKSSGDGDISHSHAPHTEHETIKPDLAYIRNKIDMNAHIQANQGAQPANTVMHAQSSRDGAHSSACPEQTHDELQDAVSTRSLAARQTRAAANDDTSPKKQQIHLDDSLDQHPEQSTCCAHTRAAGYMCNTQQVTPDQDCEQATDSGHTSASEDTHLHNVSSGQNSKQSRDCANTAPADGSSKNSEHATVDDNARNQSRRQAGDIAHEAARGNKSTHTAARDSRIRLEAADPGLEDHHTIATHSSDAACAVAVDNIHRQDQASAHGTNHSAPSAHTVPDDENTTKKQHVRAHDCSAVQHPHLSPVLMNTASDSSNHSVKEDGRVSRDSYKRIRSHGNKERDVKASEVECRYGEVTIANSGRLHGEGMGVKRRASAHVHGIHEGVRGALIVSSKMHDNVDNDNHNDDHNNNNNERHNDNHNGNFNNNNNNSDNVINHNDNDDNGVLNITESEGLSVNVVNYDTVSHAYASIVQHKDVHMKYSNDKYTSGQENHGRIDTNKVKDTNIYIDTSLSNRNHMVKNTVTVRKVSTDGWSSPLSSFSGEFKFCVMSSCFSPLCCEFMF